MTDTRKALADHPRPWSIIIVGVCAVVIDALRNTVVSIDHEDKLWPFIVERVNVAENISPSSIPDGNVTLQLASEALARQASMTHWDTDALADDMVAMGESEYGPPVSVPAVVRDEVIEECAKLAQNFDHLESVGHSDDDCNAIAYTAAGQTCDDIAAAIRALASQPAPVEAKFTYPLKGVHILQAFVQQNISGAQGCEMDCDAAQALAEAIRDVLPAGVERIEATCPRCGGTGKQADRECSTCDGEGIVEANVATPATEKK